MLAVAALTKVVIGRLRGRTFKTGSHMGEPPEQGGILAALRASPLVGANLDVTREIISGRNIDPSA